MLIFIDAIQKKFFFSLPFVIVGRCFISINNEKNACKGLKLSKNMFYVHIYGMSDVDEDDTQ